MTTADYSKQTRDVYHAQHMRLVDDERAMRRHLGMFTEEYFGQGEGYFMGRAVLDAGCGDTAKALIRFYQFGAAELHGIDLGEEFIPVARKSVAQYAGEEAEGAFTFKSGSLLAIPYEDDYFDFVCCHGVMLHLNTMDEVVKAFTELSRVTKPGGYLYTVYGQVGGLFEDAINPAIRQYYRDNVEFRELIDDLKPEDIHRVMAKIVKDMRVYTDKLVDLSPLFPLLDVDFCVFVQNLVQAPVRLRIPEEFIREQYSANGFKQPRRLRRYVKRDNIRKFMAPLHYDRDYFISRILYGSGNLEFIAEKG